MQELRAHDDESRGGAIRRCALAILALSVASVGVQASTSSAAFGVSVTLFRNVKDVAACGDATSGANISVTCTSSATSRSQPARFMLELYRDGTKLGTVDGETAPGTVASWKVYRVANRDFLEIVVGW
jgi:hypothetical protein